MSPMSIIDLGRQCRPGRAQRQETASWEALELGLDLCEAAEQPYQWQQSAWLGCQLVVGTAASAAEVGR